MAVIDRSHLIIYVQVDTSFAILHCGTNPARVSALIVLFSVRVVLVEEYLFAFSGSDYRSFFEYGCI